MIRYRRLLWVPLLLALGLLTVVVPWFLSSRSISYVTESHPNLVLHRPATVPAEQTAALVTAAQARLAQHTQYGWLDGTEQLEVWVLPDGGPWPRDRVRPPVEQPIVAAGPFALVARPTGLAQPDQSGLADAVAVAVTQPAESPAFSSRWLYEGMAEVRQHEPDKLPTGYYKGSSGQALDAAFLLSQLEQSGADPQKYRQGAAALAAFLMDRWGFDWPRHGRFEANRLSPEGALTWTTGTADRAQALERWQERMRQARPRDPRHLWLMTMAETSPVRLQPSLPALPKGPGANPNASPHSYEITARYEPSRRELTAQQRVGWENGEGIELETLYFNLWPNAELYAIRGGGIRITTVTVDGKAVDFQAGGLDLAVPLGRPVKPGEQVDIRIDFTTRLPSSITWRLLGQTGPDRFNLVHWYPQLAVLDDRGWNLLPFPGYPGEPYHETADYKVTLDLPISTQVGASGRLVRRTEQADRWIYEYAAPRVRDWAATGGRNLVEKVVEVGTVRLQLLHTDADWVDAVSREVASTLPICSERFGAYPYSDLVVTCCAGVEYPALFFTSAITPGNLTWRITVYHELAHQWFYGLVGNDQYAEPWIDEAFARYADRVASRALGAPVVSRVAASFLLPNGLHVSSSSREYALAPTVYGAGVYNLGADALDALEERIGEERFARLMREWVDRYRHQIATTADFIKLAEAVSGQPLEDFFQRRWIYATDRTVYQPLIPWPQVNP